MLKFLNQKIIIPLTDLLKQGVSPRMLALSVAAGFVIGIIPLIGVSTALCAVIALRFRLNVVAIQLVNYIAYPLQLLLYIPFIKAGESILKLTSTDFTITEILNLFNEGFIHAVKVLWLANLQGIIIWMIVSVPLSLILFYMLRTVFRGVSPEITEK